MKVAAEVLREAGEGEAVVHIAVIKQKLNESRKKGVLEGADATEVHERTAAALCALRNQAG